MVFGRDRLLPATYPYALSAGSYRGMLVGKYHSWHAEGQARNLFTNEISGKIKICFEQCLPESHSFVGFSLFMVGKVPEKTKPIITIVSDDKIRRKEAFQLVKSKNILGTYPGFELGHCSVAAEFEGLRQLGICDNFSTPTNHTIPSSHQFYGSDLTYRGLASSRDMKHSQGFADGRVRGSHGLAVDQVGNNPAIPSSYIPPRVRKLYDHSPRQNKILIDGNEECSFNEEILPWLTADAWAFESPLPTHPTQIFFHHPSHVTSPQSGTATCGGLITYMGELYILVAAHTIHPTSSKQIALESGGSKPSTHHSIMSSSNDDFEITGMDDWDEENEEDLRSFTAVTSLGSKSPSESSDFDIGVRSLLFEEPSTDDMDEALFLDDQRRADPYDRIGSVAVVNKELDLVMVKISTHSHVIDLSNKQLSMAALPLHSLRKWVENEQEDASIVIKTVHHKEIKGQRSKSTFFTRLPGSSSFLELQVVNLSIPLRPGDSGCWAYNKDLQVVGFVIAGSPKTGLCLLISASPALQSLSSLLDSTQIKTEASSSAKSSTGLVAPVRKINKRSFSDVQRGSFGGSGLGLDYGSARNRHDSSHTGSSGSTSDVSSSYDAWAMNSVAWDDYFPQYDPDGTGPVSFDDPYFQLDTYTNTDPNY
ncbi:hypothetical protein F5Y16DRAFT_421961 [Xylariaceae sp. FL0255]|nr:hypothetical protein F5Y16DRAFT_421961 [Xylariaceae sp. FL0255]